MAHDTREEPLLAIGRFAKLSHITVKTLRYYDEEGILKPARTDPSTGYRSYTPTQLEHARLLQQLRFVHVPLELLRVFMRDPTPEHQREVMDEHARRLEEEVGILQNRLRTISRKRQFPRSADPYEVRVEVRPSMPMVYLHYSVSLVRIEETRALAFTELRAYLARHRLEPAGPPTCFYPPNVTCRDEQHVCDVYAGFEVARPVPGEGRIQTGWTPGGSWYGARHHGLYEYIGYAKAPIFERAQEDDVLHGRTAEDCLHAEVYRIGPWDTPDLGQLMTDSLWLLQVDSWGSLGSTEASRQG
ncbi:MerR family transcriptional regulator [Deinococcus pimensis]|uniref:MerR family transcriptional regulator n=1 Tax=Deinococcus pimensis TaxID=309888 RepID=UPI000489DE2C|nr:MerR family transcriptional regulator [Deinococcus pimensis]